MKISGLILTTVVLLASNSAFAHYVNDAGWVDVGQEDTYSASTKLAKHADAIETAWVSSILGTTDVTYETRNESVDIYSVYDDLYNKSNDLFAFKLSTNPGYYLVKNGHDDPDTVLFHNEDNMGWGVLSYSYLDSLGLHLGGFDTLAISHVSEFNRTSIVSEPASYLLLAMGLAGLVGARLFFV
ncbi:MAG: hypothetical protein P8X89_15410 [Reinekea sp.]